MQREAYLRGEKIGIIKRGFSESGRTFAFLFSLSDF
jgi:hypothetical protein